jgi:DMSO/TMAO reductase YedYZ molybdopterin-dependent catalytic subunit
MPLRWTVLAAATGTALVSSAVFADLNGQFKKCRHRLKQHSATPDKSTPLRVSAQQPPAMLRYLCSFLYAGLMIFGLGIPGAAQAQEGRNSALLRVVGASGNELNITADDWAKLPRATVKVADHGGTEVTFEGVPARELLKLVGAPSGPELRGQQLSVYVLAEASDGYQVLYAITEFDPGFTDGLILVADRKNGEALGPNEGRLQMVVPWEKRQARWLRWLMVLRVRMAP